MKRIYIYMAAFAASLLMCASALASAKVGTSGLSVHRNGERLEVSANILLDSLEVRADRQVYISPVISDSTGNLATLPALLVNGRNMQFALERGVIKAADERHPDIFSALRRRNGEPQTVSYHTSLDLEEWMLGSSAAISFPADTCGCGNFLGGAPGSPIALNLTPPAPVTPPVEKHIETFYSIHEGKARVQFEVDRTELHPDRYVARNGQVIDNRLQLKEIDDTVKYALSDPLVEIAAIEVTGYASPESPYIHNDQLATGRSRALAEYLAERYNLPKEACTYSAVPENWGEFREMVVASDEITEQQRADLLELIDEPAYGPSDYDAKERRLNTDPKFRKLYRDLILPKWFPHLRATRFVIKTRLKHTREIENP